MTNPIEKLKPCPFCGGTDVEAFTQDEDDCSDRSAIARCHKCDAQSAQMIGGGKLSMAVRAWNRRAARETEAELEASRKVVALYDERLAVAEKERDSLLAKLEAAQFEIKELTRRLETPVPLPKAAYFKNSAENIPFFRAFSVIEAIHKAGFGTVTYED